VIRDVVLHINNEQPLLADLFELPERDTALLRCTNLRMMNGKRPVFADDQSSVFYFPMLHLRFIEVLPRSLSGEHVPERSGVPALPAPASPRDDLDVDLEIDEDFLRRIREA
jgi:hypothetical protein